MNPYTGNPEADAFIDERLGVLPAPLKSAINDDRLFDSLAVKLEELGIDAETRSRIAYDVLLILLQVEPLSDIILTLANEYELDPAQVGEATDFIEQELLIDYRDYLEDLPDADDEIAAAAPEAISEESVKASPLEVPAIPAVTPQVAVAPAVKPFIAEAPVPVPPPLVKKEEIIGARTMQGDIASLKKVEDLKPFIPSATGIDQKPASEAARVAPPIARGSAPETIPSNDPVPRYAKPLTDLPRYNNLK